MSLWFIVDILYLPLRPYLSVLLRISIPHIPPLLIPLSFSDPVPFPFPIFPHCLPQDHEIQPLPHHRLVTCNPGLLSASKQSLRIVRVTMYFVTYFGIYRCKSPYFLQSCCLQNMSYQGVIPSPIRIFPMLHPLQAYHHPVMEAPQDTSNP